MREAFQIAMQMMMEANPAEYRRMKAEGTLKATVGEIVQRAREQYDVPLDAPVTADVKMREEMALAQVIEEARAIVAPPSDSDATTASRPAD